MAAPDNNNATPDSPSNLPVLEGEIIEPDGHPEEFGKGTRKLGDAIWVYSRRVEGASFLSLRQLTGVSERRLSRLVNWYLDKHVVPQAEHVRKMEDARLDYLLEKLHPMIDRGHPLSIQTAARISESRRKLWGVDAPVKAGAEGDDGEDDMTTELRVMINAARERLKAQAETSTPIDMLP